MASYVPTYQPINQLIDLYIYMSTSLSASLSIYLSMALWLLLDHARFFSFLMFTYLVGPHRRGISPSQGRYLHTEQHKHRINAHIHASSGIRTHDPSV
jgi:hypothetical protein